MPRLHPLHRVYPIQMTVVDGVFQREGEIPRLGVLPCELRMIVVPVRDDKSLDFVRVPSERSLHRLIKGKPRLNDKGLLLILQKVTVAG